MLIVVGPFTGNLTERIPAGWLVAGGLVIMAGGLLLLAGVDEHSRYTELLPGLLIGGLGGALTIPLDAVAIGDAPVHTSGVPSGVFNTARETGGSLGMAIIGAVLAAGQRHALAHGASAPAAGYGDGTIVAAALALLTALVALVTLRASPTERANDLTEHATTVAVMPLTAAA